MPSHHLSKGHCSDSGTQLMAAADRGGTGAPWDAGSSGTGGDGRAYGSGRGRKMRGQHPTVS
uniref:Uncharacterized protein n=1 Tax=Arundo donax TaxID=35708 RepID=A0A0A9F318_ARUDO